MKLKLVVASMSILGLISSSAFAATTTTIKSQRMTVQNTASHPDYKDMGSLPILTCTTPCSTIVLDAMTQNIGRSLPNPCNPGWFNRIAVSGGINVDMGKFGNTNANLMGVNYQHLSLNDAYINLAATINDWTQAFVSISYNTATTNDPTVAPGAHLAEYSAAYSNNAFSGSLAALQLEQAYATISNFNVTPIFFQVGKQFQDFGRYEIHPITRSVTQVMSETLATSLKVGFLANGFHGALYAFDDPIPFVGQNSRPANYGVALGYDVPSDQLGWGIGAAYLRNIIGVNDIAYNVNQFNLAAPAGNPGFNSTVGGFAAYANLNTGPFYFDVDYVAALARFNATDLPRYGIAPSSSGAQPWGAGIKAGYIFDCWLLQGRSQNLYVGYQITRQASGLNLPKNRYLAGYGVDVWKNTSLTLEWVHDNSYNVVNGGSGNNTNLVSIRAAVKFS